MRPAPETECSGVVPVDYDTALFERGCPVDDGYITIKYAQCSPMAPPDSEKISAVRRSDE